MMEILKRAFVNENGGLRTGWRILAGLLAYATAFYVVLWGMTAAFGALFDAWGLTSSNLHLAPVWAQAVVAGHTDAIYALAYVLSGIAALSVAGRGKNRTKSDGSAAGTFGVVGMGLGLLIAALALLLDSMRLEWPLSEPSFAWLHVTSLIVILLASLSGEILTKRVIFDAVHGRFGRAAGYVAVAAAALLLSGSWQRPFGLMSAALMAVAGCAVYERGGVVASAAMQAGWTAATTWLLAWPVQAVSVYRMYHVSEAWLTGGVNGAMCGLGSTIGWGLIAALLLRTELRRLFDKHTERRMKDGKDQNCNCGSGFERRRLLRQGPAGDAGSRGGRRSR